MKNKNLPTLQELHYDVDVAFKNDSLNLLLNQDPPDSWVKKHPFVNTKYIPIERVEFLLTKIFQQWRVEVLDSKALFHSVAVTVRLHYMNPTNGEWSFQDGVGAVAVQTDKGASASDLGAIKSGAIMMALPAAKSYAVKDAAEQLGKIFGKDLNRRDVIAFTPTYEDTREQERVVEWINDKRTTLQQLNAFNTLDLYAKYREDEFIQTTLKNRIDENQM
jgi:hypothetical protein